MGRIRRGGYLFVWWIGDHTPNHVHVYDKNDKLISRVNRKTLEPMDTPKIDRKIQRIIRQLQSEGRL